MSNVRQLHCRKSSNRSENRPLIQDGVYRKEEVDRVVSDEEIFEYQEKIRKHENHK